MTPTWNRPLVRVGAWLLLALLWPGRTSAGQTVLGTVTRVVDGTTVWMEDAHGSKLRVRLVGNAAPQVSHPRRQGRATPVQPWGAEATGDLTARVLAQPGLVEAVKAETRRGKRTGRVLVVLHQGRTNINLWLVQSGLAWYDRGGRNDAPAALKRELQEAESGARRAVRGLWVEPNAEPPWSFRRQMRLAQ